jgi:hypothetical protein
VRARVDFPSLFDADNYSARHVTGHNMLDPESLITGRELAEGMTYENSHREWASEEQYWLACAGTVPTEKLVKLWPRVRN